MDEAADEAADAEPDGEATGVGGAAGTGVEVLEDAGAMDEAVVCFPLRDSIPLELGDELLLIRKLRGLGAGLYNGPGGKLEGDESPREAARRETREEVRLDVADLDRRAELEFHFGDDPLFRCHVFVAPGVAGEPEATEEADPEWRERRAIPYDEMWTDDRYWLPPVLDGATVEGRFQFDADGDELLSWAVTAEHLATDDRSE